jgi:hypothetical protein
MTGIVANCDTLIANEKSVCIFGIFIYIIIIVWSYSYSGSAMRIYTGLIIIKILTFLTDWLKVNHRKVGFMVKLLLLVTSIVGETALVG